MHVALRPACPPWLLHRVQASGITQYAWRFAHHAVILAFCAAGLSGFVCTASDPPPKSPLNIPASPNGSLEQRWGIKVYGPYLSGGGNLVDFRYRVLNPDKAAPLASRHNKPSLVDQTTGAKLLVPDTPKLGQLRQMPDRLTEGRVYFILFANTRHHVKHGDKVTIIAGECKLENLTVE